MKSGRATLERWLARAQDWIERNWTRVLAWRERVRISEEAFHLVLAGGVGVIGGLTNVLFYLCIESVQRFALHQTGDLVEIAEVLDPWQRVLYPAIGGVAAGLVLHWGLRLVKGSKGSGNLMEVVVAGDGRLPFRSAGIKGLSSLISIGTGASIGREGAITQLTATLASKWGQFARWQPYRLRMLVACGAAAGMAAAYNAPVAGSVFAAMVVLGNFSMSLFAPLVFAAVVATMVSRTFFGIEAWYKVPQFDFTQLSQLPWFLLLGVLAGGLGAFFLVLLERSEKLFQKVKLPPYGKLALGGLVVGLIAYEYPQVWGNGYAATNYIITARPALLFLLALFLAKLIATVAAVGAGTVGGVFTPTLFLGAALGCTFGTALHDIGWARGLPTGAFALVGMGSVLAATLHSPLLAMIMVFEISLNYSLMPPLMLACVIATLVGRRLHPESIYTAPLRARGVDTDTESVQADSAVQRTVGDLMREPVPPIRDNATLPQIGQRFISTTYNFLPVVDGDNRLQGVVALQDLKGYLTAGDEMNAIIAYDVMRPPPVCLTPNLTLIEALPQILASEQRNIPVVNNLKDKVLVGALARAEALDLLSEAIDSRKPLRA